MSRFAEVFAELEHIYAALPAVACTACGRCCASPEMTLLEAAHLLRVLLAQRGPAGLRALHEAPLRAKETHAGNLFCKIQQEDGLCSLHPVRPLICRLEGAPALDRLGSHPYASCVGMDRSGQAEPFGEDEIQGWLQRVFDLSQHLLPSYQAPYWLGVLSLDAWLALVFDPSLALSPFAEARTLLLELLDEPALEAADPTPSDLGQRVAGVGRFFAALKARQPRVALRELESALRAGPGAGAYYLSEGQRYLDLLHERLGPAPEDPPA